MATPSGQQGSGGSDSGDGDIIAVYEFCASEYGWGPDYIEAWVTNSQLIEYIDPQSTAQFVSTVNRLAARFPSKIKH
jgi:hypothetical protein